MASKQRSREARSVANVRDRLDYGSLTTLLGFHLRFAAAALYRDYSTAMGDGGLTQHQHGVLKLIAGNEGTFQVDIAEALATDRVTMIAIVDRLEERGLIRRERSAIDRRRQELWLTKDGKAALVKADEIIATHEKALLSRLPPEDVEGFLRCLRVLHGRDF